MKLTTDSTKYHSEIKKLLTSNFEVDWTPIWNYCVMTSMLIEGHSWTFLIHKGMANRKLIYRNWKRSKQRGKNHFGIFSLDDIKINEVEQPISLNTIFEIQNLLYSDLSILKSDRIILDGVDHELINFKTKQKYQWKLEEEMNANLKLLTDKITTQDSAC